MSKATIQVGAFTSLYILVSALFAFSSGNVEFVYYIIVMLVLGSLVFVMHQKITLSTPLLWGLSLWGLIHMLGGLVPIPHGWPINGENYVLYSLWLIPDVIKYDHFAHFYGFAVATFLCWEGLRYAAPSVKPSAGILTLCALGSMGLGAFNEIVEFGAVLLIPNTNVGGYMNTGWDLVANLLGEVSAAVLIQMKHRQSHTSPSSLTT